MKPPTPTPTVLAIDPGREKCGLAVVNRGGVLFRAVIPTAEIGLTCWYLLAQHPAAALVVGDSTASKPVREALLQMNPDVVVNVIAEGYSSLEARRLYEQDYPPPLLQRLLPAGMRVPPRPVDDYAAVALARRFLSKSHSLS